MEKPVIILSCDVDERDRMRMRQEYFEAVIEAGGVPVVMPPLMLRSQIDEWLDRIDADALMLTGGCDIDPQTFRETPVRGLGRVSLQRDVYELGLLEACMLRGMPVLGICRGLQVINVALGGSLYQDMLSQMGTEFARHQQKEPTEVATHEVAFIAGSMAENLFQTQFLPTNSHHHQCVHRVADDLTVSGTTVDGVVEALEWPEREILPCSFIRSACVTATPRCAVFQKLDRTRGGCSKHQKIRNCQKRLKKRFVFCTTIPFCAEKCGF